MIKLIGSQSAGPSDSNMRFIANKNSDSLTVSGTCSYIVNSYDWGVGVNKAILNLDCQIGPITAHDISVFDAKQWLI